MLNGLVCLVEGLLLSDHNMADYNKFLKRFYKFKSLPYQKREVLKKIKETYEQYANYKGKISQSKANKLLLAEDLQKIYKKIRERTLTKNMEGFLIKVWEFYKKLFSSYDLITDTESELLRVYIKKRFPKPFENMSWSAAFFEEKEKKLYGIQPGICFLVKHLNPVMSPICLAHEMTHAAISLNTKNKDVRKSLWLEEGVCETFSLFLASRIFKKELIKNIIKYRYFGWKSKHGMGDVYEESFKRVSLLYKYYGLEGLCELIRGGREKILEVEKRLNSYRKLPLPIGHWDKKVDELTDFVIVGKSSLVVSPLAFYISRNIKVGDTLKSLVNTCNLNKKETENALKELQFNTGTIVYNNGKVMLDSTKIYLKTKMLKYKNG